MPVHLQENVSHVEPAQLIVGCSQSIGRQREHNEDSLFTLNTILAGEDDNIPFGIFIVADGMGGHQHGEVASRTAIHAMSAHLVSKLLVPFLELPFGQQDMSVQEIMKDGVKQAQQAVIEQVPGGGTTLTAAFILGEQVVLAHVGDSRAYFFPQDGQPEVITRDHSLVKRLQELGQLTEQEAAVHPQRNVLYRAIGQVEPFEPDISTYPLPHPGYMLLCSDGLWGVISDDEIFQIVSTAANPGVACQELVRAANEAGGPDNISVIIIYYPK
ncbi:MAG: protein phosphatase 2C domain-containing protein [Chloroflexi bacterium]|nr:protein phosphatase 2C domain-containing protein [Chloroflexota bacterium]